MSWRITIICENHVSKPDILGEHGLAVYVETPDEIILFDTGQGFTLVSNSLKLQKDLRRVHKVVLSHGHYDHTGGLASFLKLRGPCPVIAHPDVLKERFRFMLMEDKKQLTAVGIPWYKSYLTTKGAEFRWVTEWSEISPGVYITGEIPRHTDFETSDTNFAIVQNGKLVSDPFRDDYSLVLDTPKGLVVILGCAHSGIINIIHYVIEKIGIDKIHAIIGGTHLDFSTEEQLNFTIKALKEFSIEKFAVNHCTGQGPAARLAAEFGKSFDFAPVGYRLKLT